MPRGKNYINQNKGMRLQAPSKSSNQKQECKYGSACTRKDCIYRHTASKEKQSNDPCMAYLAGICSFTGKTCRKRHPSDEESEALLKKYALRPCRFGDQCRTEGCLYNHDPKPVVNRAHIPATHPRPAIPGPGTSPALSSWMPTNALPSGSIAPQRLRPSAGSWKPSVVGSHVSAGTFPIRPPPPPSQYPVMASPYAYGHDQQMDPYGQTTPMSHWSPMSSEHQEPMSRYGQPDQQQPYNVMHPVGANPNSKAWEPLQPNPIGQRTDHPIEHSDGVVHSWPTSDNRDQKKPSH